MAGLDTPTMRQIPGSAIIYGAKNHVAVSADMSSATWNTVASHEVFTVTGAVRLYMQIYCTETLTDAADGASIQFGLAGATDAFIASTGAAGAGGNTIEAGEFWIDATPADTYTASATLAWDIGGGLDVGYEITGAALTDGTLVFSGWWFPLSAGANVVAGAGGSL